MIPTPPKPQRTLEEVASILGAPGSIHETEQLVIDGRVQRVYKNAWPSLRVFWLWAAQEHRNRDYVVYEDTRLTFGQAFEQSVRAANVFQKVYGIKKGDRVGICCRNYPEFLVVFWATMLIGAVSVQVNAWLPLPTLSHCITNTECKLIILDSERADRVEPAIDELITGSGAVDVLVIRPQEGKGQWKHMKSWDAVLAEHASLPKTVPDPGPILPEDNAQILFTSGTTGTPKGALSTQRMVITNLITTVAATRRSALRRGESILPSPLPEPRKGLLLAVPMFHVTAQCLILSTTLVGIKIVLLRKWNASEAIRLIKKENIGSAGGVPSIAMDITEAGSADLPLETLSFGGAPTPKSLPGGAHQAFPSISLSQGYGMTETTGLITSLIGADFHARPSSCGLPTPVNDIIIVKDDKVVPTGEVGELWVRGANIMKGYWRDPDATRKVLTKDGWYKTGDMACKDHEGFLYIKDRIKDIIIRGGENIDSVSVENAFYADQRILEAAAVGIPHPRLGEQVAAVVHIKPRFRAQITEETLIKAASKALPHFARPVLVIIQDKPLERTPTGKIVKGVLRELAKATWETRNQPVKSAL